MNKVKYVDPMIGTVGDEQSESCHGGGKTHPGAVYPGGMVQLSPDTVTGGDNGTGYNYCHNTIEGFSFNHMSGIGWYGDLGNIQLMPVTGETDLRSGSNREIPFTKGTTGWKSPFSHDNEHAQAGYYSVFLDRYKILTECTAASRTGMMRITYPENTDARLIFNFSRRIGGRADYQKIRILGNNKIEGTIICTPKGGGFGRGDGKISYNLSFVCEFSVPAQKLQFFTQEEYCSEGLTELEHEDTGLIAHFGDKLTSPVLIKCSISYTDIDGARLNFTETEGFDFDSIKQNTQSAWEDIFSCINVEGTNETDLKIFYTCLYHTLLDPRITADLDGRFSVNNEITRDDSYTHRTMFSGWDVYRSEFPLLTLISPETVNDEVNSLLRIALKENSSFPKWELMGIDAGCMVGDPGLIVIADAFVKGIRNYDAQKVYDIANASCRMKKKLYKKDFHSIYPKCPQYAQQAFVPERLSNTLEFLLAEYTMSRLCFAMGKKKEGRYFANRAASYPNNFYGRIRFLSPRKENGRFIYVSGRYDDEGCVESNIFQQTWAVPYDVRGLAYLIGERRTLKLLEQLFEKADLGALWSEDYNHSNEPCHNITHYFSILGSAHRTQYWTRRVQKEAYSTGAFGFCGNEDVGQLSAWYVLSALGFAQICPAYPAYFFNTPLFRKAEIKLDRKYHGCKTADTFSVVCDKDPLEFPYIEKAFLNGKEITRPYLFYSEITDGGEFSLILSDKSVENSFTDVPWNFLGESIEGEGERG